MYNKLQRQNSFGPPEKKSTLIISRAMELKILDGESSIPNASPVVLESINKSIQSLINSYQSTKPLVRELPDFVRNTTISHCDLSEQELIDKRYGQYFEGYALANNVQYIPVEIECLANLSVDLCRSILSLFVSVVFEYITDDNNLNESELVRWGSTFLTRMGKILNLTEPEVLNIIKPVSQSLELKQLGMNFDDLKVEKQLHINHIQDQLGPMQESINEFFKQTVGTSDENQADFDYTNFKDYSDFIKTSKEENYPKNAEEDSQKELSEIFEPESVSEPEYDDEDEEYFKKNFIEKYKPQNQEKTKDVNIKGLLGGFLTRESEPNVKSESTELKHLKVQENIMREQSESGLSVSSKTNVEDEEEEEEEDELLKAFEKSMTHKSSKPTNAYDNLLTDMSNLNIPPKKSKSMSSKILGNISKRINRVFSINSEKSARSHSSSSNMATSQISQEYLNNLLLIEKSPDVAAVLVRNLLLKFIISGFNDSRAQVIFTKFSNFLGVASSSVLSIENNIVSDLVGILDVNAAKTSTKKMSKRLKILSATVGGTALLALTAGVASPVLAVGIAFLGLSGTGVSTYLGTSEGSGVLKNLFGQNVSLTQFKIKRDQLTNLQFIQLNPNSALYRESSREGEGNKYNTKKENGKTDSNREREDVNNYIGICLCVGNNVFLNEIFFFENDSIDFKSNETIRHFDSEYIDIWKKQFPVPINDLYLLKWESKMMASLHRMLLKLTTLSIYNNSLELYKKTQKTIFKRTFAFEDMIQEEEGDDQQTTKVRDSSGGYKIDKVEGSSGNYYSEPKNKSVSVPTEEERGESGGDSSKDFYKDYKDNSINWPLGLIQLCSNLDNCWLVCRNRAEMCGQLMANAISDKLLTGDRHVSLVGYSMGARVIFYCLLALFERNKLNVVKDVVLMGLPSTAGHQEWSRCSSVVAGRLINVYNDNDWILAFLYRYTANHRVAGLAPVFHPKVENFNVSTLFSAHVDYLENISKITSFLNIHL